MAKWEKGYQDWLKDTIENFDISDFFKQKTPEEFVESEYVSELLDKDATYGDFLRELKKTKKYDTEDYPGKGLDWFGDIKKIREQRKKESMEGLVKGAEQRGWIMKEGYGQYDRPEEDIERDILLSKKPERKPKPEKDLSMWQKIGKHFAENADARDKLFTTLGSVGREMVKPIQPGQEAAGALLPTLSRGLEKGEATYAAKEAAATKRMLDIASARQKINPLQYYSSKMSEARLAVPSGTDPDSAEGKRWIGNYLKSVGIPSQVVDLTSSLESLNLQVLSASSDEEKKRLQGLINQINTQLESLITQSIGGSSVTSVIDYSTLTGL
jgi:hypothetical protein